MPPRFGATRRETEARLERLRTPLPHSRRLTLVGAYQYSGRATATMVLGSLLASVRGEPVLALDGAPAEGALDAFLTRRNDAVLRDLAALPPDPEYAQIRARTTRLPSGLEVVAHHRGHLSPSAVHAQDYAHLLACTAPYYPFVLTDWAPLGLDRGAEVVLDRTDRLVVCCGTADWFLDAAAGTLSSLREAGRVRLADEAVVVATDVDSPSGRRTAAGLAERLRLDPARVVHVPFDPALHRRGWELGRLRAATVHAFLDLAELALGPGAPAPDTGAGPGEP